MKRLYQHIIEEHLNDLEQMVFMPGPRQVGKTTIARNLCQSYPHSLYLNWDFLRDRETILSGSDKIIEKMESATLGNNKQSIVVFDEIHKYKKWKNYLKGFFDYSKGLFQTLVTGSAKLDVFKKDGDSLMGRYFLYRIHPFSVGELLNRRYHAQKINSPKKNSKKRCGRLYFISVAFRNLYLSKINAFLIVGNIYAFSSYFRKI